MKRYLIALNVVACLVILAIGADRFIAPQIALAVLGGDYQELMFRCDHAMREHFIAKQLVLEKTDERSVRNLDAAEVGLVACHDYDRLRKRMLGWGVKEAKLATLGLDAIEARATDIRTFVRIHEIRY